jgi:hypothetical protein
MSTPADVRSTIVMDIPPAPDPDANRRILSILADTYTFIRSMEANKAISAITIEDLVSDQIKRNGSSDKSAASQYDPYSYNTEQPPVASQVPTPPTFVNQLSGSDTGGPTKMDRLQALKNALVASIDSLMKVQSAAIEDEQAFVDAAADATATELEEM